MCRYNHWVYTEGTSSYGVFQLIGLESSFSPDNGDDEGIDIKLNFGAPAKKFGNNKIAILDMAGAHIRTIDISAKTGKARWDMCNMTGELCSPGVYIVVSEARGKGGENQRNKTRLAISKFCN